MASLKKAVEAKCKDCTYDQACPGSWRAQVEACTVKRCPLWEVRPVTMETIIARRKLKGIDVTAIMADLDEEDDEVTA